jgi:ERI1 exoribonuclease 3
MKSLSTEATGAASTQEVSSSSAPSSSAPAPSASPSSPASDGLPPLLDFLVVVDFEATCDSAFHGYQPLVTRENQEIIEFPWVVIDVASKKVVDQQQYYVRPEWTQITPFCTQLTGIREDQLTKAKELKEVLAIFGDYLKEQFISSNKSFALITDGDWDCKVQLLSETSKKGIPLEYWGRQYINVQRAFFNFYSKFCVKRKPNLKYMLSFLTLEHCGRHHSGIDDCLNIGLIINKMMSDGFLFHQGLVEIIPEEYNPDSDKSVKDFNLTRNTKLLSEGEMTSALVRIKGLPWGHDVGHIVDFFAPLEIKEQGVTLLMDKARNLPSGTAFVEFLDIDQAREALKRHRQYMGHRYIEVFPSSDEERKQIFTEAEGGV